MPKMLTMGQGRRAHQVLIESLRETSASESTVEKAEAVIASREAEQSKDSADSK